MRETYAARGLTPFGYAALASEALLKIRGEEVIRCLIDVADEGATIPMKLAAVKLLGQFGSEAKDAFQVLFRTKNSYKGRELGNAAQEALKQIQKKP